PVQANQAASAVQRTDRGGARTVTGQAVRSVAAGGRGRPFGRERMSEPSWLSDLVEGWPVVASSWLAKSTIVNLKRDTVQMPGGEQADREVVEHPGAVAVLALDENCSV